MKSPLFVLTENIDSLERLRTVLVAGGYEPKCFASFAEFLSLLPGRQTGCVVVNLTGGALDDPAMIAAIRECAPRLRTIVLATASVEAAWRESGAFAVLSKPCSGELLLATISRATDGA
jgi:FixJ family two-component response regulator